MSRIAVIDGDSFIYRAGFAVEKTKYLVQKVCEGTTVFDEFPYKEGANIFAGKDGIIWSRKEIGPLKEGLSILDGMIRRALDATSADLHFTYLSGLSGNFRDSIATIRKYKGNRDGSVRPIYYSDLREHIVRHYAAIVTENEEADDRISWQAREMLKQDKEVVIIGIDKDLLQIPGEHYDWVSEEHITISPDEARIWLWTQVLAGDPGDNIPGCWKFGIKNAERFVLSCEGLADEIVWPKVVRKYKDSQKLQGCPYAGMDAEVVALETARLVRLKQSEKEELWTPPTRKEKKYGTRKEKEPEPST